MVEKETAAEKRRLVIEVHDARSRSDRVDAAFLVKTAVAFALDAIIFVCITHLASVGVLSSILAGGLLGSLIGARIYAARTRALGATSGAFASSTIGALILGIVGSFSLHALRS